ncbi:MAG: hypothetical protein ACAI38_25165 [Myxococcota bacterium]|nr:hypothetical protein [Myxococcota bacterium]
MKRGAITLGLASLVLCTSTVAMADPGKHDGFYMQLQGGLGYYSSSASSGGFEQSYSGLTIPAALLLGRTAFIPGLSIGGGLIFDTAPSPGAEINGTEVSASFKQFLIGLVGFADYYLQPEGGLHLQAYAGWGGLETSTAGGVGGSDPTGLLLGLGAGYDFFISDEWSFGVMGRLSYGAFSIGGVGFSTIAPAVVATLTYN